jgi:hypothetical protein
MSDPVEATDWRQFASNTAISEGMFIGGERRAASSDRRLDEAGELCAGWLDTRRARLGAAGRCGCCRGCGAYGI